MPALLKTVPACTRMETCRRVEYVGGTGREHRRLVHMYRHWGPYTMRGRWYVMNLLGDGRERADGMGHRHLNREEA